ncbi:MAG: hypothetical protein RLY78_131 [Pseudomonadota bacterium]
MRPRPPLNDDDLPDDAALPEDDDPSLDDAHGANWMDKLRFAMPAEEPPAGPALPRRWTRKPPPRADDGFDELRPSKTRLKQQAQELQQLGADVAALPDSRLKKLDLPDGLRDAIAEYRRTRSHEGKRRQLQYIGKRMRDVDPAPLQEAVAAFKLGHATDQLKLHEAERWRSELVADADALTRWARQFPSSDLQQLRTLIRNARKDAALAPEQRNGRGWRELFQFVKPWLTQAVDTEFAAAAALAGDDDDTQDAPDVEADRFQAEPDADGWVDAGELLPPPEPARKAKGRRKAAAEPVTQAASPLAPTPEPEPEPAPAPPARAKRGARTAKGAKAVDTVETAAETAAVAADAPLETVRIGVVSISDRASAGVYQDQGIPALQDWLGRTLRNPIDWTTRLIPDEREGIAAALRELVDEAGCDLVLTTGGTGPALRDVTPEATRDIADREMPGFGEQMRQISLRFVPTAILSRQVAVIRGRALVINLPGQPRSIAETLQGLPEAQPPCPGIFAAVPYCIDLIGGPWIETDPALCQAFRPKTAVRKPRTA